MAGVCGLWVCVGALCVGTLVSCAGGAVDWSGGSEMALLVLKMLASCSSATVCSDPKVGNGDAGLGLHSVWIRSVMAWMTLSLLESCGIGAVYRKILTVSEICTLFVEGM